MKTYVFKADEDGASDFTVTTDDNGRLKDSDHPVVKNHIGDPLWQISGLKHRYRRTHTVSETNDLQVAKFDEVGTLAKYNIDKRQVFGWAYVTHDEDGNVVVDKSGEFIDDWNELEDAAYTFVIKSRVAGDMHQRDMTAPEFTESPRQVGTMIESVVFTPEKIEKMGIPQGTIPTGWWVGFQVTDDQVWNDVLAGKRPAFSIHGKAKREEVS